MHAIETVWEARTYDVWGNKRDGYEVNDTYSAGTHTLRARVKRYNEGTKREFIAAGLSAWQIGRLFGTRAALEIEGDDTHYYVTRAADGYPIGELHCVSHSSLSPIRR